MTLKSGPGTLGILDKMYLLPQGTQILTPPARDKIDFKIKTLEESETRLRAENIYMKNRVKGWQPGGKTLLVSAITGIVTGIYIGYKL